MLDQALLPVVTRTVGLRAEPGFALCRVRPGARVLLKLTVFIQDLLGYQSYRPSVTIPPTFIREPIRFSRCGLDYADDLDSD